MLNTDLKLNPKIFDQEIEKIPTRNGYGEGLVIVGERDPNVVVLTADLAESTRCDDFRDKFPDRFIEVGVAEQALVTVASGMANYGKIPFISSYATFSPGRNWEQIRTTIALNDVPVKIAGHHTGVSVGPDGATHQALEDIALMRVLPNMIVISPCDAIEAKKATIVAATNGKPTYLRFAREKTPIITTEDTPFEIGKAEVFFDSVGNTKEIPNSVTIIATGPLVYEALMAARSLEEEGIHSVVINCHTIKPLDEETIIRYAKLTGAVVTVEEHQIAAGLGGAIAEFLAKNHPTKIEFVGMNDHFGESGTPEELISKFDLGKDGIIKAVKSLLR